MHPSLDRGVQYASGTYPDLLQAHGFQISMSRRGNPYDNAQAESSFKTLKSEGVYLTAYRSRKEVKERLGEFIDQVYPGGIPWDNRERLHSALGYVSPGEFEITNKQPERDVFHANGEVVTWQEICPA